MRIESGDHICSAAISAKCGNVIPSGVFITGVCGFVGGALADALLEFREEISIFGVDNLRRPGSEMNRGLLRSLGVQVIHGDIRMPAISKACRRPIGLSTPPPTRACWPAPGATAAAANSSSTISQPRECAGIL